MSVIDGVLNQRGIQVFGTEFADTVGSGDGSILNHPNGDTYVVFAKNYQVGVAERRLYLAVTVDEGKTYQLPVVQLTSGGWDDEPSAIVLDPTSSTSEIGIVYNSGTLGSAPVLKRVVINTAGAAQTPFDVLFPSQVGTYYKPQLLLSSNGVTVFMFTSSSAALFTTTNTDFTHNSWTTPTTSGPSSFCGSSTNTVLGIKVWRMANFSGQYCALITARTALDGLSGPSNYGQAIAGTVRADLFFSTSTDEGGIWSTAVNLTNYSGTPQFDLVGIPSVISASGIDLSDGTIAIGYQEAIASQCLSDDTSFPTPSGGGPYSQIAYHAAYNYLFVSGSTSSGGLGGLVIYDLTGRTRTRLSTSTTPALWSNNVQDIALSADGKYLVLAEDESLDIMDISSGSTISGWTITGIRTASTPPAKGSNFNRVKFDGTSTAVYASYGSTVLPGTVWGLWTDAASPTVLTDLSATTTLNAIVFDFIINSSAVAFTSTKIISTNKTSGVANYQFSDSTAGFTSVIYDTINLEYIIGGSKTVTGTTFDIGLFRVEDLGSSFLVTEIALTATSPNYNTSLPCVPSGSLISDATQLIPGVGAWFGVRDPGSAIQRVFYSFAERTYYGPGFSPKFWTQQNEVYSQSEPFRTPDALTAIGWLPATAHGDIMFFNKYTGVGRIRWNKLAYDPVTQILTTGNWYDIINFVRVDPTTPLQLRRFDFSADANNQVYGVFQRVDFTRTQQLFSTLNAFVDTDAYRLQMRARIRNRYTPTIQCRARMQSRLTRNLITRARVVRAGHISMKAHIIPRITKGLDMKAKIQNYKSVSVPGTYEIETDMTTTADAIYYVLAGQYSTQGMTMKASITRTYDTELFGTYAIMLPPDLNPALSFNPIVYRAAQTMTMKALIGLPNG